MLSVVKLNTGVSSGNDHGTGLVNKSWACNWKHVWQTCVRGVRHAFYALTRFPYCTVGLTNPWHACPKRRAERFHWYAAFTAVPVLLYFFRPTSVCILWRMCVCVCTRTHTHIWLRRDCMWITVATKNTASETFLHTSVVMRSVDWIFITGAPFLRWPGKYMTLDKMFYILLFK
jgi:hypothetical protein